MKHEWQMCRNRYIPAILPIFDYWSWAVGKKLKIKRGMTVNIWDKGWYSANWERKGKEELANHALNHLLKNVNHLDKVREEGIKAGQKVVKHCENFSKNIKNKNYKNFISFFDELRVLYNIFIEKSMVYWLFTGELVEEKIKSLIAKYSEGEEQEILKIMSIPKAPSYSQIEEQNFEEILKIAKKYGINDKKTKSAIEKFSEKYFWFPYEYVGPDVWDVKPVTKRIKEGLEKFEAKKYDANISKKQQECKRKFNLPKKLVDLFEVLQIITLIQDDRKMFNAQACYYINGIIAENLAERFQTSIEHIRYLEVNLLNKFLKDGNKESLRKELTKRSDFLVVLQTDNGSELYTGNEAKNQLKKLGIEIGIELKEVTEIRGCGANQGIAKGRVRILLTSSGVTDFKKGDILVTPMTTPDFVPLIGKAAAIVTDEGGITSHAAIVSREFDIPCIVGTNDATKVLKDGDLVEVDANKGIVKMLKRKEKKKK